MNANADRSDVRTSYTQPTTLGARSSIYAYRRGDIDLRSAIAELIDVRPGARVLDIGCGETPYFTTLAAKRPAIMVGVDASAAMLQRARTRAIPAHQGLVQGGLDALPVKAGVWDVVIAAHCLYHADDPRGVLTRLPPLLRAGGRLYVILNGRDHLQEIRDLSAAAGHPGLLRESARLTAEDAIDLLSPHRPVTTRWFEDELHIPDPDPVVSYVNSTRAMYETQLPDTTTWPAMLDQLTQLAERHIAVTGDFRVRTRTALIQCE